MEARASTERAAVITLADLDRWLATAEPGERFTYFIGSFLPPGMAIVAAARKMAEDGAIITTSERRPDRLFNYLAVKRRNADAPALSRAGVDCRGSRSGLGRSAAGDVDEEKEWLMAVLRRLASFGKACGTNAELAVLAQLKDAESVRYRMGLLVAEGRIDVQTPPQGPRVVTIVASGRKTAA